ncbi:MAG: phosphoribosylformylglycinamidine synthase subunit PurS, partial [Candidatus Omnitrophica bacterium]|nr:phosphoribosylformylglycinamidine synthase subunit PurS [Candidatus Omnitrophota bacterium]
MFYKIEVKDKPGIFDAVGDGIKKDISDFGIDSVLSVHFAQVYLLEGNVSELELKIICEELLTDKISQDYSVIDFSQAAHHIVHNEFIVEVAQNPGVMDPVEDSALKGIRDLGINGITSVKTSKKYLIKGKLSEAQLKTISEKLLYNKLIQHLVLPVAGPDALFHRGRDPDRALGERRDRLPPDRAEISYAFKLINVDLLNASDDKLMHISKQGQLFLNLNEMRQIKKYFKKLRRNPTDCELETIAQTWSEHCYHKTFRGKIKYREQNTENRKIRKIDNLLKSTIMKVTKELNKPWCVSVFKDNSGVI